MHKIEIQQLIELASQKIEVLNASTNLLRQDLNNLIQHLQSSNQEESKSVVKPTVQTNASAKAKPGRPKKNLTTPTQVAETKTTDSTKKTRAPRRTKAQMLAAAEAAKLTPAPEKIKGKRGPKPKVKSTEAPLNDLNTASGKPESLAKSETVSTTPKKRGRPVSTKITRVINLDSPIRSSRRKKTNAEEVSSPIPPKATVRVIKKAKAQK